MVLTIVGLNNFFKLCSGLYVVHPCFKLSFSVKATLFSIYQSVIYKKNVKSLFTKKCQTFFICKGNTILVLTILVFFCRRPTFFHQDSFSQIDSYAKHGTYLSVLFGRISIYTKSRRCKIKFFFSNCEIALFYCTVHDYSISRTFFQAKFKNGIIVKFNK